MPRTKTKTDDEVLAALERVLLRLGPHAFTLADVGEEAALSPAAVLQRFGSKRGLLVAFARRAAENAAEPFEAALRSSSSPLEALWLALTALAADVDDRVAFANSMALLLEDTKDDALRRAAGEHARLVEDAVAGLLDRAVAAGEIASNDTRELARLVYAAWNGALIQWALRGEGPLSKWVEQVLRPVLGARLD